MWPHLRHTLQSHVQQGWIRDCRLEVGSVFCAASLDAHAPRRKLWYAPQLFPELLELVSACRRLLLLVQIGARASVLFSSLGTSPAKPLRSAMTACCCF